MSTTVDLYENKYLYQLPEVPRDEKQIIGHDIRKKADQYWRTPTFPEEFTWSKMSKREQFEIVDIERYRWEHGVWFMNKGEPTWITGMHYDHLVNATFDHGKCFFTDSQKLDFYFRDYVRKDPMCYGQCTIKPRRYGYSLQEITQQTYEFMWDSKRKLGMMSNNKEKTYESLFNILVQSYVERPEWVRPDIYMPNEKIPKTKLWANSGKVGKKKDSYSWDSHGNLNSLIFPKPTTVIGYDGNKLHYLTMDEAWKWTLANPYACWRKQRPTLNVGGKIIGKASILSTMGDDDDYEAAIEAGIQMFQDSDPFERDDNGHTKSGLYHRFIAGEHALFEFMDVYGIVNMDQAGEYIMNGRKQYEEGTKDWLFEVRRYPRTLQEATSTATGIGLFNNARIEHVLTIIKNNGRKTVIGKLELIPESSTTFPKQIIMEPNNNGDWEFDRIPKITKEADYSNRFYRDMIDGTLKLAPNPQGVIGYDAIRYAEMDTVSKVLSMSAIVGYQKFDYYGNGGAGTLPFLYHARPDDPEKGHYEAYKCSLWTGFPIATERQVESMVRRMAELYATSLLLSSHYDGKLGFWTTTKSVKDGVDLIQNFFKQPKTMNEVDYLALVRIARILEQAKKFDTSKKTIFDIMLALIQAFLGSLQIKETAINEHYNQDLNSVFNIIQPKRTETIWNNQQQQVLLSGGRLEQE